MDIPEISRVEEDSLRKKKKRSTVLFAQTVNL